MSVCALSKYGTMYFKTMQFFVIKYSNQHTKGAPEASVIFIGLKK